MHGLVGLVRWVVLPAVAMRADGPSAIVHLGGLVACEVVGIGHKLKPAFGRVVADAFKLGHEFLGLLLVLILGIEHVDEACGGVYLAGVGRRDVKDEARLLAHGLETLEWGR